MHQWVASAGQLRLALRDKASRFPALEPAVVAGEGVAPSVASSLRVAHDLTRGRISHPDGFQIAVGIRGMSIVVDGGVGKLSAMSTCEPGTDYEAFSPQMDRITTTDPGKGLERLVIPLALTPEGIAAMNVKLQTNLFTVDRTILAFSLTSVETENDAAAP